MLTTSEVQDLRVAFEKERGYSMSPTEAHAFWVASLSITLDEWPDDKYGLKPCRHGLRYEDEWK